jgi:hypothetical protein
VRVVADLDVDRHQVGDREAGREHDPGDAERAGIGSRWPTIPL